MASLVSARHTGFVSSRCAISYSLPDSRHESSKGGSNELKLLPWTLPELKRLLWRLVFSTSQSLFSVWHWSIWRRQKQQRSRQCHYRRAAQRARPSQPLPITTELKRITYPTILSDRQWAAAQRVIPVYPVGRPCTIDLRQVLNALCYMQANHCSWRMLPDHFPCWQTVSSYLYRWRRQGVWETICEAIRTTQ